MSKYLIIIFLMLAISSCALTGVERHQSVAAHREDKVDKEAMSPVSISCPGYPISMMMSPAIPLPPVIPMFFVHSLFDEYIGLKIETNDPEIISVEFEIVSPSGWLIKRRKSNIKEDGWFGIGFSDNKCDNLDGAILTIIKEYDGFTREERYKLSYHIGEFRFFWGYLGA